MKDYLTLGPAERVAGHDGGPLHKDVTLDRLALGPGESINAGTGS